MVNDSQMQLAVQFSSNMPKISRPVRRLRSLPLSDRFPLWFRRLIPLPAKVLSFVVLTAQNPSGALAQGTSATRNDQQRQCRHGFSSSGSGTLDYIKEQVLSRHRSAVKMQSIPARTTHTAAVQSLCRSPCYSAGYFWTREAALHELHRVRLQPHRPR